MRRAFDLRMSRVRSMQAGKQEEEERVCTSMYVCMQNIRVSMYCKCLCMYVCMYVCT